MLKLPKVKNPFDKRLHLREFSDIRDLFLRSFGSWNTICHNADPSKKISQMKHRVGKTVTVDELHQNHKGSDVYFYVNGVRKQNEVKRFAACFCDLDAGRDANGKYLDYSKVRSRKERFLTQINNFSVKPSWVVETRNGFQCYWLLTDNYIPKANWNGLQKKLANYFGADVLAIKPNQIMRVPYTYWHKKWEGKAQFFCSIHSGNGQRVSSKDLQDALNGVSAITDKKRIGQSSEHWFNQRTEQTIPVPFYPGSVADELSKFRVQNDSSTTNVNDDNYKALEWIDFLNQASKALYFSDNKYLSRAAKKIAKEISDRFCVG